MSEPERDQRQVGHVVWVNGPVVRARGSRQVSMLELVEVGEERLVGEVIGLEQDVITIQVYEETSGLRPGAPVYGTYDIPAFGDPEAPAQQHLKQRYIEQSTTEIGVPNTVTAVLASYRGYDTLGEVIVIFTAGIGVMLLIGGRLRSRKERDNP